MRKNRKFWKLRIFHHEFFYKVSTYQKLGLEVCRKCPKQLTHFFSAFGHHFQGFRGFWLRKSNENLRFPRIFHFVPTLRDSFSMTTQQKLFFSKQNNKYFPRSVDCAMFQRSIYLFSPRLDSMKIEKIGFWTFTTLPLKLRRPSKMLKTRFFLGSSSNTKDCIQQYSNGFF